MVLKSLSTWFKLPLLMARILCIGADDSLLRTRCAVLAQNGHEAVCSLFPEAEAILGSERFDLIVISACLRDREKAEVLAIIDGKTPTIMLEGLTMAPELLTLVDRWLAQSSLTETS
jgi:DNA-binding response OmpR family regulator